MKLFLLADFEGDHQDVEEDWREELTSCYEQDSQFMDELRARTEFETKVSSFTIYVDT